MKPVMNWGVPDWRDASAYPTDLSIQEWRWQFLRRRHEYRKDWRLNYERTQRKREEEYNNSKVRLRLLDPKNWRGAVDMPECRKKYGVTYLLDPLISEPSLEMLSHFYILELPPSFPPMVSKQKLEKDYEHTMSIPFDMTRKIGPQVEKAKATLKVWQQALGTEPEDIRYRQDKWPEYLRVLDAKEGNASLGDIAKYILSSRLTFAAWMGPAGQSRASMSLEQACEVSLKLSFMMVSPPAPSQV